MKLVRCYFMAQKSATWREVCGHPTFKKFNW